VHGGQITFDRHLFDRTFPICPKKKRAEGLFFSLEERKPKGGEQTKKLPVFERKWYAVKVHHDIERG
jgi:hypothetical protein